MYTQVETFCIPKAFTVRQAIAKMNENRLGIILVVDDGRRLVGTVTDGDVRRAVLAKFPLENAVIALLEQKAGTMYARPLTALEGREKGAYLKLLKEHKLSHLPIVNEARQVVALVTSDEFINDSLAGLDAVVMAGGRGTRLYPLTEELPKPMLPVGEKPLLEIILGQLRGVGIQKVNVTTHHKPERIRDYFGDGTHFGMDIRYVAEDRPLGTAGSLGLLDGKPTGTILVINGDILTQVDLKAMLMFHQEHAADLSIAVRSFDLDVPYGVIECEGTRVSRVREKPKLHFLVNAGIYLLEPQALELIPAGQPYHMTDLAERLIAEKMNVISFPVHEYWLDIGAHAEYERAQKEFKNLYEK